MPPGSSSPHERRGGPGAPVGSDLELDELYQKIILDHYRRPRGAARLEHVPDCRVHENPTCGDAIKLEIALGAVRFEARGCAISTASASIMSETLTGRSASDARAEAEGFIDVMRGREDPGVLDLRGDLACLKGVIRYPLRVKCATLAGHALLDALADDEHIRARGS